MIYAVTIRDIEVDQFFMDMCSKKELSTLLANIDEEKYEIIDIHIYLADKVEKMADFYDKPKNLEVGK